MFLSPFQDTEKYTAALPRVRVKPSQLEQLRAEATRKGYAKKLGEYIRLCLFKSPSAEKMSRMSRQDVLENMKDLARIRKLASGNVVLLESLERISKRHLNALADEP